MKRAAAERASLPITIGGLVPMSTTDNYNEVHVEAAAPTIWVPRAIW